MWYGLAGIPALLVVTLMITAKAARRFEARERQLGRWDQYGPLQETEAPQDTGSFLGSGTDERSDVKP